MLNRETSTISYSYFEDENDNSWVEVPSDNLKNKNVSIFVKALVPKNQILIKRIEKVEDITNIQKIWIDKQEEAVNLENLNDSVLLRYYDFKKIHVTACLVKCHMKSLENQRMQSYMDMPLSWGEETEKTIPYAPMDKLLEELNSAIRNIQIPDDEKDILVYLNNLHSLFIEQKKRSQSESNLIFCQKLISLFTNFTKNINNLPSELKDFKNLSGEWKVARKSILAHRSKVLAKNIEEDLVTHQKQDPTNHLLYTAAMTLAHAIVGLIVGAITSLGISGVGVVPGSIIGAASFSFSYLFFNHREQVKEFRENSKVLGSSLDTAQGICKTLKI